MKWDDDALEQFIVENRDKFDVCDPSTYHDRHFFAKLANKFKKIINLTPYFIKFALTTIIIFTISFFVWRSVMCPPLSKISFKYWKVEHFYIYETKATIRKINKIITTPYEKMDFDYELNELNLIYKPLKKEVKTNPSDENINKVIQFYQYKLETLREKI